MATDTSKATDLLQALVGSYLSQLGVGVGQLHMYFSDGLNIAFENDLSVDGGPTVRPHSLDGLSLLLPLLSQTVTEVEADQQGALLVSLGATRIRCEADPHYEAWNYNGTRGSLVVSMPGGDLAIWSQVGGRAVRG